LSCGFVGLERAGFLRVASTPRSPWSALRSRGTWSRIGAADASWYNGTLVLNGAAVRELAV